MNFTIKSLLLLFNILQNINTFILRIGRQLAWIAILLMVIVIIIQVFFRYDLNNALHLPDEVARFFMLWMTGLIAPSSSIKIPFSLIGGKTEAMKLAWMYMSLPVGIFLLILVNIELALRNILSFFNSKIDLPLDKDREKLEA